MRCKKLDIKCDCEICKNSDAVYEIILNSYANEIIRKIIMKSLSKHNIRNSEDKR